MADEWTIIGSDGSIGDKATFLGRGRQIRPRSCPPLTTATGNHRTGLKSMISGPFFIGTLVGVGCRMMVELLGRESAMLSAATAWSICSIFEAPTIGAVTPGWWRIRASAICAGRAPGL
jgi:hypothetical protein